MNYIKELESRVEELSNKLEKVYKEIQDIYCNKETCNLIEASRFGHLAAVKFHIDNGSDIHANDDAAVRFACLNNHLEVAKFLVAYGADVRVWNDAALREAYALGHKDIIKYLEYDIKGP